MRKLFLALILLPLLTVAQNNVITPDSIVSYGGLHFVDTSGITNLSDPVDDYDAVNLKTLVETVTAPIDGGFNQLISGSVIWDSLLFFSVTDCEYFIQGVNYTSSATQIELATADATNDRLDIIAVDTNGVALKITGTPASDPAKPVLDPLSQLELTTILVQAGATTPSINTDLVYDEGVEWDTSSIATANVEVRFLNTDSPNVGSYCLKISNTVGSTIRGGNATFTDGTTQPTDDKALTFYLRTNKEWQTRSQLVIYFINGISKIGAAVISERTLMYGFDNTLLDTWQRVSINIDDLVLYGNEFDKISFYTSNRWTNGTEISLDYIELQDNITPPQANYYLLTNNDLSRTALSIPSDDASNIVHSGIYRVASTTSSMPITGLTGTLIASYLSGGVSGTQFIFIDDGTDDMYISSDKGTTWTTVGGGTELPDGNSAGQLYQWSGTKIDTVPNYTGNGIKYYNSGFLWEEEANSYVGGKGSTNAYLGGSYNVYLQTLGVSRVSYNSARADFNIDINRFTDPVPKIYVNGLTLPPTSSVFGGSTIWVNSSDSLLWFKPEEETLLGRIQVQHTVSISEGASSVYVGFSDEIYLSPFRSASVTLTEFRNPTIGEVYKVRNDNISYTITIEDAGDFDLNGDWIGNENDVISLLCIATDEFIEISRSNLTDGKDFYNMSINVDGVTSTKYIWVGEQRSETTGVTGDYATDFSLDNQHLYLYVNSITGTGNVTITGTSISESTGVPTTSDTEVLTLDASTSQYWQTNKKWLEVTNIDIPAGITAINYDIGVVGYLDAFNIDFKITGLRVDMQSSGVNSNLSIRVIKVQDDGAGKMSIVDIEHLGMNANTGVYTDDLRTGGDDRSYTYTSTPWASGENFVLKVGDYDTYFSSDENIIEGKNKAEGIIIVLEGTGGGNINNVENLSLNLEYQKLNN